MHRKTFALLLILLFTMIFMIGCGGAGGATLGLSLSISSSPAAFEQPGDTLTFTYMVTNTGNRILNNVGVAVDSQTASCPLSNLDPGAFMECSSEHVVTDAEFEAGVITISAIASGTGESAGCGGSCGGQQGNIMAFGNFEVKRDFVLKVSLVKTSDSSTYTQAGQQITYTYTLENTGVFDITDALTVQDDLVEVTCPDAENGLPVGGTLTCTGVYTITEDDMQAGSVTNTAFVAAGDLQTDPVSLTVTLEARPALTLAKTASPNYYTKAGDPITYTFLVTNTGNVPLTEVEVVDPSLASVDCPALTNDVLLPGESVTCTGIFNVTSQNVGKTITNIAAASAKYGDISIPSEAVSAVVYYYVPVTETPPPADNSFCYQVSKDECYLKYWPICRPNSETGDCEPNP